MNKKLKNLFVILFAVFTVGMQAQELSKSEKKSLKKEIKALLKDPMKYKKIKDNLEIKDVVIKEQLSELTNLSKEKNLVQNQLTEARDSIGFYETKIETIKSSNSIASSCKDDSGMKYRVQIGLYREFDISRFLNEVKVTSFEKVDGMFRYSIGNFKTEDEAELFKEAIRTMGIDGAFVSYYLDGLRVPK